MKKLLLLLAVVGIGLMAVILHQRSRQSAPQTEQEPESSIDMSAYNKCSDQVVASHNQADGKITAYRVKHIAPEVLERIMNMVDTMRAAYDYPKNENINWVQRGEIRTILSLDYDYPKNVDPGRGEECEVMPIRELYEAWAEVLVVVNNLYQKKAPGFSIYFFNGWQVSPKHHGIERWSMNQVRKYGYTEILGYRVLLVDEKSGRDYFTIDKNLQKQFFLYEDSYSDKKSEDFSNRLKRIVLSYRDVDGKLIYVSKDIMKP